MCPRECTDVKNVSLPQKYASLTSLLPTFHLITIKKYLHQNETTKLKKPPPTQIQFKSSRISPWS